MRKRFVLLFLVVIAVTGALWAGFRFGGLKWHRSWVYASDFESNPSSLSYTEAVDKIKEARLTEDKVAHEIPPELKHYEDRHWFLATQVAEVAEHNVGTCQDFVDLARMHQSGEVIALPAVTQTYVLYKVGERADEKPFARYYQPPIESGSPQPTRSIPDAITIELYGQAQVTDAYQRLEENRAKLETEVKGLKAQSLALKKGETDQQRELQKEISARQNELNEIAEQKSRLDEFYSETRTSEVATGHSKETLFRDYEVLQSLAKNLGGRTYDLNSPSERQSFKVHMLSSLRPEAVKVLEEVAGAYHRQFNRPLPVSSLFRTEQYQHALRRVNRNAVTIDTPPHSTGLAFDIDYRYMGVAEQNFVMNELARLKQEGRIEVIRERNANYHVFAFLDGRRPSDDLIRASLEAAGADPEEEEGSEETTAKSEEQKPTEKRERATKQKQKAKTPTAKARTRKRR